LASELAEEQSTFTTLQQKVSNCPARKNPKQAKQTTLCLGLSGGFRPLNGKMGWEAAGRHCAPLLSKPDTALNDGFLRSVVKKRTGRNPNHNGC